MSAKTTNFNLHKIDLTDAPPDITVLNQNWDTIDNELKTLNDRVDTPEHITPEGIGAAPTNHGNHVPATQTADNATFLRNDNTWQKVTPANIGAAEASHSHDLEELGTVKLYRYLEQLGLTPATATTNAIMQAMEGNSMAILDVTTSWTAATEIPNKYTTMVLYKRYNGRTTGTLTSVASEHIWFGSQHSGGSFAGWKEQYGEHNIATVGVARIKTGSYTGTGTEGQSNPCTLTFGFEPKFFMISLAQTDQRTNANHHVTWLPGVTRATVGNNYYCYFTQSGNSISWYGTNKGSQFNTADTKYYYIVIG